MTITVVTGFSPHGYNLYGWQFLETFNNYWPEAVRLLVYTEEPIELERGECRSLWDIPGCRDFIEKHKSNERANGITNKKSYDYRYAAWKFCRQAFIPAHAARGLSGLLIWLDGDVRTDSAVTEEQIIEIMHKTDVAYLGRKPFNSEIGFIGFRLPQAQSILNLYAEVYRTEKVFDLPEWHSGFVFDYAREQYPAIWQKNITNSNKVWERHVWPHSPLAKFSTHLMGRNRKKKLGAERGVPDGELHL